MVRFFRRKFHFVTSVVLDPSLWIRLVFDTLVGIRRKLKRRSEHFFSIVSDGVSHKDFYIKHLTDGVMSKFREVGVLGREEHHSHVIWIPVSDKTIVFMYFRLPTLIL